ncbi:MAG: SDR family oxidoreductase [Paludibacteraceae bacterium]|nr:SDR family oxidoreductase [Paludibacteraceae bacterium]
MNKTIFITGGASGIGAATVSKFISEGWNVLFTDIHDPAVTDQRSRFVRADSSKKAELERAALIAEQEFGGIDALFCNSGIHRRNTVLDITQEELDLVIQTNIYGTVYTLQAVLPYIIRRGSGSVVLNSSDQFFVGKAHSFAYGMTKGAIGQIARSLAIDLGPKNIRVNAICPGTIHTPLVDNLFAKFSAKDNKTIEQYWKEENALFARGQAGRPEEVAEMVYFLISDKASFCTGGHYLIDGGLVCQ